MNDKENRNRVLYKFEVPEKISHYEKFSKI